jgi:DNA-binding NarL/FixJ family response regulator
MVTHTTPPSDDGTVLIVEDHELIGASLRMNLRAEGIDAHLCGPSGGADAILFTAARLQPGVVLLDLDLGRDATGRHLDGATLVEPLCEGGWRIIVLSGTADRARVGAALAAGAVGVVAKRAQLPALLSTVRDALAGREVMAEAAREVFVAAFRERRAERGELADKLDRLTPRELEVLRMLADGHRAQAVAQEFVVSLATVRTQIRAVLTKLGVKSQLEAVALYRNASGRWRPPSGTTR